MAASALLLALALAWMSAMPASAAEGRRAAVVIGNSDYRTLAQLPNAASDASRVARLLRDANFEVTLGENLDKQGLERTVRTFLRTLNDGDIALFYYSGHAVQVAGENYILPTDASLGSAYDLETQSYNVGHLLDYMRQTSSMQIVILDSCRDNPFKNQQYVLGERTVEVAPKDGLAALIPRQGSLIVYSTAPDEVAYDGGDGASPFTAALADHLPTPNVEVRELLTQIRSDVIDRTGGRQVPWDVSSLVSRFYFVVQQNVLVVGESLGEIRVSPQASRVELGIAQPIVSRGLTVEASFDRLPQQGELRLGDTVIGTGTSFDARRLHEVTYVPAPGEDRAVELMSYAVRSSAGDEVRGMVAVVFDPSVSAPPPDDTPPLVVGEHEPPAPPAPPAVEIAMAPVVGTGFASLSDAMPPEIGQSGGWLRVAARDPATQIAVGDTILSEGDLVRADDLSRLAVRPTFESITADWGDMQPGIVLSQAGDDGKEQERIVINLDPTVHRCDELAGDRLDIQGVIEGVFPNDIPVAAALEACREAVGAFPDVARFRHQLGRVLYAQGEYEAAIVEFRAALAAGHVRSGDVLGRIYQYGAGVPRDPASAIPLFEAAAARGDAYAQHSLAKSLLEGNGVEVDVDRSLDLYGRAVEAGHTYAMNGLGAAYRAGQHVAKDEERAYRFFLESAERGDVWGLVNLGLMYRDGSFVEKDEEQALELFREANEGLHPYAGTLIALMIRDREGVGRAEVFELFRTSAERGDAFGAYYAADLILSDSAFGSEGDAIRYLALAAARGGTNNAAAFARDRLRAVRRASIVKEAQNILTRLGVEGVVADGALGPRTRDAASAILGTAIPSEVTELLIELANHEWIAGHPRFDML